MRDFRKLEIWHQSLIFVKLIYEITASLPAHEKYGLASQMNRSAVSVPSNIAEGCSRKTATEFSRFLEIAIGSAFELETQLEICSLLAYINSDQYLSLITELNIIQKRLNLLREKMH